MVERIGVAKAGADVLTLLVLAVLAGAADAQDTVSIAGSVWNLVAVTAGNVVGGTLLVAGVYWVAYLRRERMEATPSSCRQPLTEAC